MQFSDVSDAYMCLFGFMGLFWTFWLPALQTKACQSHIGSDDTFHWQVACLLVLGADTTFLGNANNPLQQLWKLWHVLLVFISLRDSTGILGKERWVAPCCWKSVRSTWVVLSALVKKRPQNPQAAVYRIPINHARLLLLPCPSSSTIPSPCPYRSHIQPGPS